MATKKKKYRTGSGTNGVIRNYLPDPLEANANAQIMMAKAEANAQSDPFAMGLDMMAMYSQQIGQGLGGIKGAYGLEGEEQINVEGNEIVDDPTMGAMEMLGPSHDEGGIDMDVSPETNVFSDKVIDPNGKTMAEKKKKREKAKKNLVRMLEEDSLDKPRRNAYERKLAQLEAEEEQDLQTQDEAGMFAELMGLPHTGEDGFAKYGMRKKKIFGGGTNPIGGYSGASQYLEKDRDLISKYNPDFDPSNPDSILGLQTTLADFFGADIPELKDAKYGPVTHDYMNRYAQERSKGSQSVIDPELRGDFPTTNITGEIAPNMARPGSGVGDGEGGIGSVLEGMDFDMPQIGDMVKLAGNLHGMTSQMRNVKDARAGDTPHPNHYKDVGKEAVATLEGSKGDLEAMKANQESRIRREAVGNRRRGRRSARGINQMRATDAVTDMQTNMAELDIFDNIASKHMGIDQAIAQTQMGASQAVARGAETARDLTDRDRHSYYSAKGRALGDVTKGLQQTGKDLNQMALNPVQMRLLEALGEHYTVDKKGNVTRKK